MTIFIWTITSLIIFWLTALFYTSVMAFKKVKDDGVLETLHWSSKSIGYSFLYTGLVVDMLLNIVVMTVLFIEPPKEILTTSRIKRFYHQPRAGYRHRLAKFFAKNYLLPFDPKHMD